MGRKIIQNGKVLVDGNLIDADILIVDGKINYIGRLSSDKYKSVDIIDAKDMIVAPGIIDIHTHGGNGIDINHATVEDILNFSMFLSSHGVTGFLPTILTDTHEKMLEIIKNIVKAKRLQKTNAKILGIHMEGPFLSKEYKGSMPEELIQNCSIDKMKEYEKASEGLIKYVTIAPDNPGAEELIAYLKSKGIVSSMGHSGAEYGQCMRCIDAGITSATHIFNAMRPIHQHYPSIVGAALESNIYTEIISDGRHLHPAIVRLILKTKGVDRVISISDSMMAAGLPDGLYKLGINDVVVKGGDASLVSDGTRAGSTLILDRALKNLMEFTKRPLEECILTMTMSPANLLGLGNIKGRIDIGYDGDIILLDGNYNIKLTIVEGNIVYRQGGIS